MLLLNARQGIFQLKDVKRAVIEQNGQLIVVKTGDDNPKYPIITEWCRPS